MKKIISILLLIAIASSCAAPCFAVEEETDSSMETFLSVLDRWGSFLARLTGAYDVLDHITRFSDIAREWRSIIGSGDLSPGGILSLILSWLGFSHGFNLDGESSESYSL